MTILRANGIDKIALSLIINSIVYYTYVEQLNSLSKDLYGHVISGLHTNEKIWQYS